MLKYFSTCHRELWTFTEKSATAMSRMRSDVACVMRIGTGISAVGLLPLALNLRLVMAKSLHSAIWDEKLIHSVKPHFEQH